MFGGANGLLLLRPINAEITHDVDWFEKMDPLIIFNHNGQQVRSSTCFNGGKRPYWSDQLEFQVSQNDIITLTIYDHNTFERNQVVANGEIQLSKVFAMGGNLQDSIPIYHHNHPSGVINIYFEYKGATGGFQQQGFQQGGFQQPGIQQGGFQQQGFQQGGFQQPGFQQQGFVQTQPTYQQGGFQQPGVQVQYTQGGFQQPGLQQGGFVQTQPTYQQGGFQQPGFQQGGFQQPGVQVQYSQGGFQQPGFQQGGFVQPGTTVIEEKIIYEEGHHHHHHHHNNNW